MNSLAKLAKIIHTAMPITVGTRNETADHFQLPVSFFIVIIVVEHGQCISENSIMLIAVIQVQPFARSRFLSSIRLDMSVSTPVCI